MADLTLHDQAESVTLLIQKLMRRLFTLDGDDPAMQIPGAQMRVCGVLREGPRTMSALSRELGVSLSAVTQIADRLEQAAMVERVPESDDRRCKLMRLTPRGSEIMQARLARRVERVCEALQMLSDDERKAVLGVLEKLLEAGMSISTEKPGE